jgi:hypothetical protein
MLDAFYSVDNAVGATLRVNSRSRVDMVHPIAKLMARAQSST